MAERDNLYGTGLYFRPKKAPHFFFPIESGFFESRNAYFSSTAHSTSCHVNFTSEYTMMVRNNIK